MPQELEVSLVQFYYDALDENETQSCDLPPSTSYSSGVMEICVPSTQFCCELKTSIKNKIYFKDHTEKQ